MTCAVASDGMTEQFDFTGTVALVAGDTGGIGRHVVADLQQRGATVVGVSRTSSGEASTRLAADLRSPEEATRVVDATLSKHGRIDIVVNAVGAVAFGDAVSVSVDTVEELFLLNAFAHMFLCTAALPHMSKPGVIVGISGVIAERNLPGMAAYGASKAATRSFNEAFAREARRSGVRVIDARPPHTETGLAARAIEGTSPRFPEGLDPRAVSRRIVEAIANGETDLPSTAFA